jgi:hypothetical protein
MTQPVMTMRNRGFKVISGLLVCMGLLLLLLPGAGALPPAQAQEPDVSAALTTITRSVSGSVTFATPCYDFSGTSSIPLSANATVSQVVQVKAGSGGAVVRLKMTANLNSAVPINIYVDNPGCPGGGTASSSSANMSGSAMIEYPPSPGYLVLTPNSSVPLTISASVPVSGSKLVDVGGSTRGVYVYTINQPIYGTATIELLVLSGSATFPLYTYLPMIARQEQPAGGAWSDDFSEDREWRRLSLSDVCDVGVEGGTLRVKLKKAGGVCWISAPVGVFLAQGTFQVDAVRTSDKKGWFGLVFNATTSLLEQRWQLDAAPWDGSDRCGSGKARVKLSYKDGSAGDRWPICTNALKRNKNEWNTLKVVRSGDNVKAYINGEMKIEVNDGHLKDAGLFDLVVFGTEKDLEIWFDNFSVTP